MGDGGRDVSEWRDELTKEEQSAVDDAQVTVAEWHGGSIDCWRWKKIVARLAEKLDECQAAQESNDTLGEDQ